MVETDADRAERDRKNDEREDELRRVPLGKIDKSKWPKTVRPIAMSEADGLGVDGAGRLYWDGKPVEIIGQRLDLTKGQFGVAIAVAVFTFLAALATCVQAAVSYHDWACKTDWPSSGVACPTNNPDHTDRFG
jgi:hypothetical protein